MPAYPSDRYHLPEITDEGTWDFIHDRTITRYHDHPQVFLYYARIGEYDVVVQRQWPGRLRLPYRTSAGNHTNPPVEVPGNEMVDNQHYIEPETGLVKYITVAELDQMTCYVLTKEEQNAFNVINYYWYRIPGGEWKPPNKKHYMLKKLEIELDYDVSAIDALSVSTRILKCANGIADGLQSKLREAGYHEANDGTTTLPAMEAPEADSTADSKVDQLATQVEQMRGVIVEAHDALRNIAVIVCTLADQHADPQAMSELDRHISDTKWRSEYVAFVNAEIARHRDNPDVLWHRDIKHVAINKLNAARVAREAALEDPTPNPEKQVPEDVPEEAPEEDTPKEQVPEEDLPEDDQEQGDGEASKT